MKKIGVLFGMENSFPGALVEYINGLGLDGIEACFVTVGAVGLYRPGDYAVIVDRISHQLPFYRAFLKQAALGGTVVINNPFWAAADDKFLNYSIARKLGVAVPPTVLLPHKIAPGGATSRSLRNLEFPLDWDAVFAEVGEHGFLKPIDGGGWRDVHEVRSREEFFHAYDQTGELCMVYQKAVEFTDYFRCYVVGQKRVRIMPYDPRRPHAERYLQTPSKTSKKLLKRIERDAITLCRALGYDLNTVEFAVADGIPYAIDFMNPVPDAAQNSVGEENFQWIVREVANLAIAKAKKYPQPLDLRWQVLLGAAASQAKPRRKTAKKRAKRPAKKFSAKSMETPASSIAK
jgi:hypothetical protein